MSGGCPGAAVGRCAGIVGFAQRRFAKETPEYVRCLFGTLHLCPGAQGSSGVDTAQLWSEGAKEGLRGNEHMLYP